MMRKRRKISSNISRRLERIGGRGLPDSMAEIIMAARSSETQKREDGELATFSKMSGMTTKSASARRRRKTRIRSSLRSWVNSKTEPKCFKIDVVGE